jgi:hypothetical protein
MALARGPTSTVFQPRDSSTSWSAPQKVVTYRVGHQVLAS